MHNKVVFRIARGLRHAGAVVLRFNFRGVGKSDGEHAHLPGEIEDCRAALGWLRARYPALPFALAGFSFGARVVMRLGCEENPAGGPQGPRFILAAGFPTRLGDAEYLQSCAVPKIFIQSTRDQYGPVGELEALYATVPGPRQIHWIEAGDHFFAGALERLEETVSASVLA